MACLLLSVAAELYPPLVWQRVVDVGLAQQDWVYIGWQLALLVLVFGVGQSVLGRARGAAGARRPAADARSAAAAVSQAPKPVGGLFLAAPHRRSAGAPDRRCRDGAERAGAGHQLGGGEWAARAGRGRDLHLAPADAWPAGAAADDPGRPVARALQLSRAAGLSRRAQAPGRSERAVRRQPGRHARHPILRAGAAHGGRGRERGPRAVQPADPGGRAAQSRVPGHPLGGQPGQRDHARRRRLLRDARPVHARRAAGLPRLRALLLRPDRRSGQHQRSGAAGRRRRPADLRGARRARNDRRRARQPAAACATARRGALRESYIWV